MNKEVEVKGIQMKATTGNSLEINIASLGTVMSKLSGSDAVQPNNATCGTWDDYGWQRSIDFNDYYKFIAKLKPASTNTALTMVNAPDDGIRGAGAKVLPTSTIETCGVMNEASLVVDDHYGTPGLTSDATPEVSARYIDIPMWIRTNESTANKAVQAWVSIDDITGEGNPASALKNAVRVAFIPISSTDKLTTGTGTSRVNNTSYTGTSYTKSATWEMDSVKLGNVPTIFALGGTNATHYDNTVLAASSGTKRYDADDVLVAAPTLSPALSSEEYTTAGTGENAWTTGGTKIFSMPAADTDNYACVQFVCRIWLEGESTDCNDSTSNNDWSINMHFNLVDNPPAGGGGASGAGT